MMEMVDIAPEVDVPQSEYNRLLGYPRDFIVTGRARELALHARQWYAKSGRPWLYVREASSVAITDGGVRIDDTEFRSPRLRHAFEQAEAHSAMLVAVSAGPEVEGEAQRLWREEKPDEYFFIEMFGSAVVEHLTTMAGARLCDQAERVGMAVLPHYSPGYAEWNVADQPRLLEMLKGRLPRELQAFDSGMLSPKKSQIAVFGLTRRVERVQRLTELVPCQNCSYARCQYRRAPNAGGSPLSSGRLKAAAPSRQVNPKALKRWARERLTLRENDDSTVDATFRYDGTTCTNMGRPLAFVYHVKLGPREDGFPIEEQRCAPAPDDTGHRSMCRYIKDGWELMRQIDEEKPLLGRPLNDVLSWQRASNAAGCYCEPESREHKWGLVLETIHWALSEQE